MRMRRTAVVLAVALGLGLAVLLRVGTADTPDREATLRLEIAKDASCGTQVRGEVYVEGLSERTSRLGSPVGLGAYNIVVSYPPQAFRLASDAPTAADLAAAPIAGDALGDGQVRTWVSGRPVESEVDGAITFGAFSYVGSPNTSRTIDKVDVVDDQKERELAGTRPGEGGLLLGTFQLMPVAPGEYTIEVDVELVDSSVDVLEYENPPLRTSVVVAPDGCADVPPLPTVTPPPVVRTLPSDWEYDDIPTPRPHPNEIPADEVLRDIPDVCAYAPLRAARAVEGGLCLPAGWELVSDPAWDSTPIPGKGGNVYLNLERNAGSEAVARISIQLTNASEPFSVTQCSSPVSDATLGKICLHEANDSRDSILMPGTWRLIGITTPSGRFIVIEVNDYGDTEAKRALQQEAVGIVAALLKDGWR